MKTAASNTVLLLGARGRFGQAAARAFAHAGWRVLAHMRPGDALPPALAQDRGIQSLSLDLRDTNALASLAQGATVVVHALNPIYTNKAWARQALPMLEFAIKVSRQLGATLMLPGNIYNFGAQMPAVLNEDTPQLATTVKGQVRIGMEAHLRRSGVRGVVIRAGDFFGAGHGTWFDSTVVKDLRKGVVTYPGPRDVPTAWAYLPDLARAFVAVAERRADLKAFEVFHFAGHSTSAQGWMDVLTPLARAQGWIKPPQQLKYSPLPWPIIRLGALVNPTWAALTEMRYLWQSPSALANDKLVHAIGQEPHTPLNMAAEKALLDLGLCADVTPMRGVAAQIR